jgi:hypothetical protein
VCLHSPLYFASSVVVARCSLDGSFSVVGSISRSRLAPHQMRTMEFPRQRSHQSLEVRGCGMGFTAIRTALKR